jgi:hypothetical protein
VDGFDEVNCGDRDRGPDMAAAEHLVENRTAAAAQLVNLSEEIFSAMSRNAALSASSVVAS